MRTWDDWSDFEVNCGVAIALGCDVVIELSPSSSSVYCGYEGLESTQDERDYCNSWGDIGPFIANEKISLHWHNGVCTAIGTSLANSQLGMIATRHEYASENPLRAAAIAFLMMNGVKNDR